MTMYCGCKSEFQDQKYGKGIRVHNIISKETNKARCTVCGKTNVMDSRVGSTKVDAKKNKK